MGRQSPREWHAMGVALVGLDHCRGCNPFRVANARSHCCSQGSPPGRTTLGCLMQSLWDCLGAISGWWLMRVSSAGFYGQVGILRQCDFVSCELCGRWGGGLLRYCCAWCGRGVIGIVMWFIVQLPNRFWRTLAAACSRLISGRTISEQAGDLDGDGRGANQDNWLVTPVGYGPRTDLRP